MNIVITYDVNNKNKKLKDKLTLEGFFDFYRSNELNIHYLPDTTLISHRYSTLEEVQNVFEKIIEELNVGVIREVDITRATHFTAFEVIKPVGIPGEAHT